MRTTKRTPTSAILEAAKVKSDRGTIGLKNLVPLKKTQSSRAPIKVPKLLALPPNITIIQA